MSKAKKFASPADMEEKKVTFSQISEHAWAYTAEGDLEHRHRDRRRLRAGGRHPGHARDGGRRGAPHPRSRPTSPIKYVPCSRTTTQCACCGAAGYGAERHPRPASDTRDLIVERGEQDKASEIGRFPRLFQNVETVPPGLTWPTMTFTGKMTLRLGKLEVQLLQLGRGHTKGDTVVWLPQERTLLAGDLVEFGATPYCGRRLFQGLAADAGQRRRAQARRAGAGPRRRADHAGRGVAEGLTGTRAFIADVYASVQEGREGRARPATAVYKDTYDRSSSPSTASG